MELKNATEEVAEKLALATDFAKGVLHWTLDKTRLRLFYRKLSDSRH